MACSSTKETQQQDRRIPLDFTTAEVISLLLLLAGDIEVNPGPPGIGTSVPIPTHTHNQAIRESELLELSAQLDLEETQRLIKSLGIRFDAISEETATANGRFRLLDKWNSNCSETLDTRSVLSQHLCNIKREDLEEQLEKNQHMHVTECMKILAEHHERSLEAAHLDQEAYITPKLRRVVDGTILDDPFGFLEATGKRVLIEGDVGTGKTILMRSLLQEWIRRYKDGQQIPLLFLLSNDEVGHKDTLVGSIYRKYFESTSVSKDEVDLYMLEHSQNVILALDAVGDTDSFQRSYHGTFCNDGKREELPDFGTILTSRPGNSQHFDADLKVHLGEFDNEDISLYIRQYFKDFEESGTNLLEFLEQNVTVRQQVCRVPLLCGVMCNFWREVCGPEGEDKHWKFGQSLSLADVMDVLADNLIQRKLDHEQTITPTRHQSFLASFEEPGSSTHLEKVMQQLGKLALNKLNNNSFTFRRNEFKTSTLTSFDIVFKGGVVVKRGDSFEFVHPIIQARFASAYILKVHNKSTIKFKKALSLLDRSESRWTQWVYRFIAGCNSHTVVRDLLQHLTESNNSQDLLCECMMEADLPESTDMLESPNSRPDFELISWPTQIHLEEPNDYVLAGLCTLLATQFAGRLKILVIEKASEVHLNPSLLFLLQQGSRHMSLTDLKLIRCDLTKDVLQILLNALCSTSLRALDFSGSTSSSELMNILGELLPKLGGLEMLKLPDSATYPCSLVASLPKHCPVLEELSISFKAVCEHEGECEKPSKDEKFDQMETLSILTDCEFNHKFSSPMNMLMASSPALQNLNVKVKELREDFVASFQPADVNNARFEIKSVARNILNDFLINFTLRDSVALTVGSSNNEVIKDVLEILSANALLSSVDLRFTGTGDDSEQHYDPTTFHNLHETLQQFSSLEEVILTDVPLGETGAVNILYGAADGRLSLRGIRLNRCKTDFHEIFDAMGRQLQESGCEVQIVHGYPEYMHRKNGSPPQQNMLKNQIQFHQQPSKSDSRPSSRNINEGQTLKTSSGRKKNFSSLLCTQRSRTESASSNDIVGQLTEEDLSFHKESLTPDPFEAESSDSRCSSHYLHGDETPSEGARKRAPVSSPWTSFTENVFETLQKVITKYEVCATSIDDADTPSNIDNDCNMYLPNSQENVSHRTLANQTTYPSQEVVYRQTTYSSQEVLYTSSQQKLWTSIESLCSEKSDKAIQTSRQGSDDLSINSTFCTSDESLCSEKSDKASQTCFPSPSSTHVPFAPKIPYELRKLLCRFLNRTTLSGNDWRELAVKFDLEDYIWDLQESRNHTDELFNLALERSCFSSLPELRDILEKMERLDCAEIVDKYIRAT